MLKSRFLRCVVTALVSICAIASQVGAAPHVLVIGIDGLRADAMEVASTPNIDALIANGTYSRNATSSDLTFSGPGWSDIFTGVHRDQHGVATNGTSDNPIEPDPQFQIFSGSSQHLFPDFLALANTANPALQTARFTGQWNPIHTTRSPAGSEYTFVGTDTAAAADAASYYANPANDAHVGMIYFANPDFAGHGNGFNPTVTAYTNQISATDAQIGSVVSAIQSRPSFATEDWMFILTSDHGGDLGGGHSGNQIWQRTIPFIVSGGSVINQTLPYGAKLVDVAPTALAHLGVALPGHLVGHVVGLSPAPLPTIAEDTNLIFNGGGEFDHGFANTSLDQAATGWDEFPDSDMIGETASYGGADSVTVIAYGSPGFPASGAGDSFFAAGGNGAARMTQTIDVSALATEIDGGINFELKAQLGGDGSGDRADWQVEWFDAGANSLGGATLTGPTGVNGLALLQQGAMVPVGARSAVVTLATFGNGAYADNLFLRITEDNVINVVLGDFDGDGDVDGDDWLSFAAALGTTGATIHDLTGDNVVGHEDFLAFENIYDTNNGEGAFGALLRGIPEPGMLTLVGLAALAGVCRRRRTD